MFTSCLVPQAIALASNVMDKLGEPGQYTLFAPTNDAFDKMNPDYLENIMEDPAVVKGTVKMWCLNESIKYNHNIFTLFLWPGKYAKKKGHYYYELLWATMSVCGSFTQLIVGPQTNWYEVDFELWTCFWIDKSKNHTKNSLSAYLLSHEYRHEVSDRFLLGIKYNTNFASVSNALLLQAKFVGVAW